MSKAKMYDIKHTLKGTKLGETGKAVKFRIDYIGNCPVEPPHTDWFPFSQIDKISTTPDTAGEDTLLVSEWILKAKDLV